jgi:1-acyl-sn-glycerol-3-phosphate acyltransferase
MKLAGVKTVIVGKEKLPVDGPAIYISNHESVLDIPTVMSLLPSGVNMFAKRSLFRIPIFGWAMYAQGFVPVVRKNRKKARRSLAPAERALSRGRQLFIFPEGTRSRSGTLGQFKTGAFRLGIATGAPIVPLALIGAHSILPPRRRWIRRGTITMVVGDQIETTGLDQSDRHELKEMARDWIKETREAYSASESD